MASASDLGTAARTDRIPYRSRRLEALLGAPFGDLQLEHLRALVTAEAEEAFDLDFKLTTYGANDEAKRDLAGDVAALANTAGGALVIGVDEDEQGRATATPGVDVTDAEATRMSQIIAANLAPMPTTYIKKVVEPGADPGPGFYVIAVPPSPLAPHAVLINGGKGLRYPRRNGASIRYLSEPEVAAAYRARDLGAMQQSTQAAALAAEANPRLPLDEPWLLLALVPDIPGDAPISRTTFEEFRTAVMARAATVLPSAGYDYHRAQVAPRSFIADDAYETGARQTRNARLQVYRDGAGSYALRLYDTRRSGPFHRDIAETQPIVISDEWLAIAILSGLHALGDHAQQRAATSGNGLLRAEVVLPAGLREVELRWTRAITGFDNHRAMTAHPHQPLVLTVAVDLDAIATAGPDLVATAAQIGSEIVQSFGLADLPQFTSQGQISVAHWASSGGFRASLTAWAEKHGIALC